MWLDKRQSYQWRHTDRYARLITDHFFHRQICLCLCIMSLFRLVYILICLFCLLLLFAVITSSFSVFVCGRWCTLLLLLTFFSNIWFHIRRQCSTYWNNNTTDLFTWYTFAVCHTEQPNQIKWRRKKCEQMLRKSQPTTWITNCTDCCMLWREGDNFFSVCLSLFDILFAWFLLDWIQTRIVLHSCIGDCESYCERSMPIVWCVCVWICACLCRARYHCIETFVCCAVNTVLSFRRQITTWSQPQLCFMSKHIYSSRFGRLVCLAKRTQQRSTHILTLTHAQCDEWIHMQTHILNNYTNRAHKHTHTHVCMQLMLL